MAASAAAAASLAAQAGASRVLESFDDAAAFHSMPSDGVRLDLRADSGITGRALRFDFDYQGHAGYAVARRPFVLPPLPLHYAITLWVRGEAKPNTLELKLVDSTGQNVWWLRRPELRVAPGWTQLRFRPSDLTFAWGPLGGGPPRGIAALEIAITAGQGGRGWIALDDLTLTPLAAPVADSVRPRVSAATARHGQPAAGELLASFSSPPTTAALPKEDSGWHSATDGAQWVMFDFGGPRPLSGLVLDWSSRDWPVDYDVETSDDGRTWSVLHSVRGSGGGRRFVHLPGAEPTMVRLALRRSSRGAGYGLRAIHILSDGSASTRSAFLERIAAATEPGAWPRPLTGQQSYWTVVGLPRDERDALFSEDGSIESRPGSYSVEPLIRADGHLLTWRDGKTTHSLDDGSLPIPSATRTTKDLTLKTTAFATGTPGRSVVWARYRVVNQSPRARAVDLFALVRPVQVNPPWQFLGTAGGAATVRSLRWDGRRLVVNDTDAVVPITPPTSAGVVAFDSGSIVNVIGRTGGLPRATALTDPAELAEGGLSWRLSLAPHDSTDVWIALPDSGARSIGAPRLEQARALWKRELGATRVSLPGDGARFARTLRTALADVLINARGPAIQPGTRSYRRSWIRDGALTSAALLRLGHAGDVRAFLDWYVPNVFANGKVPCCVDARGADPVTENDADGELLYLTAEYWRMTHDTATVVRHWPTLAKVAAHLDSLRQSRRTAQYRTPDSLFVFGLLPPSISHEGYSAKPAYSYWDDWWGVRGLDDAGTLARVAGDGVSAARFAGAGREMRRDVVASVARSMTMHRQETLPGAAELGDTDPTSSTMALEPAQALDDLPRAAVRATFDSAWATLERRRDPRTPWEVFVPYEWRDVGAFIRLGQPERAHSYARWLLDTQRPTEWNQWSEAVWRDARAPKFIGDMPHGWVASDFIRATLDMLAFERERDSTLVVGAGIPLAWARTNSGVTASGIHTWWGSLDLRIRSAGSAIRVNVDGVQPPGGIELYAPFGRLPRAVTVNGAPARMIDGGRAVMVRAPAVVEFLY
jgi:hypothetical protein